MAYCPTYTNPQVKADFNSIVEDYGGKPLSNMEFRSRKLRGERFGKDKFAMDVAYYMWDKHQGNMEQIFADKEGAKYRLSKPTEVYEQVEDVDLSLDHLTDAERSYLEAEATIYDPFADEERVYDTHKDRKRVTYVQNIESTPTEMSQEFLKSDRETLYQRVQTKDGLNNKQQQINELFESNPELANEVYKALGFGQELSTTKKLSIEELDKIIYDNNLRPELFPNLKSLHSNRARLKGFNVAPDKAAIYFLKNILIEANRNQSEIKTDIEDIQDLIERAIISIEKGNYGEATQLGEQALSKLHDDVSRFIINQIKENLITYPIATINQITPQQKQQAQQLYSQYLESLNKPNTNPILQGNQQEQVKKFAELQERLNNKEFLEGAKNAYESSKGLQEWGTQEQYNDYIARVSLGIVKNPSSGEYNYGSKVKDIVYHGSPNIFDEFSDEFKGKNTGTNRPIGIYFTPNNKIAGFLYQGTSEEKIDEQGFRYREKINSGKVYAVLLNFDYIKEGDNFIHEKDPIDEYDTEGLLEYDAYVAKNKEQIHILGSKQDVEGFKKFIEESSEQPIEESFDKISEKYPEIKGLQDENLLPVNTVGQADLQAGTVLIDMVNGKADTPYHEYAHHFIGWFRNTEIVQEGIKKWGSEEALVQSIGEQALKQKGDAWNWWTRFVNWMQNLFGKMSSLEKQELTNILTGAFLNRIDLETGETLTSERIQELRNQLSGEYIQHQRISEQEAATNILNDIGVEVKENMTQQDHINNMAKLRENIAATEIDINQISEETLKKLQLDPEKTKYKRVYVRPKTGEVVAEMSVTDKVTVKKLKNITREELEELSAKHQGDLKAEWGTRNHLTLQKFTEYFVSTENFEHIHKNNEIKHDFEINSLKDIHKESRLNAKDSRELQLGIEDMLNWIDTMQKGIDPKGKAKILTEQVLINTKDGTPGTADLLVIFSDNSYGQVDFKTMYPSFRMWGSKTEGGPEIITDSNWIHASKKEDFRMQLMANNHTLEDVYNLGKRRFSRVIPIAAKLGWDYVNGVNTDSITHLIMARSNREGQNLYGMEMLPLALGEKVGIKKLDSEIDKLYTVLQNKQIELKKMTYDDTKYSLLKQEIENLDKSINSAIIRKDLYYLRKDIKRLINLYHEKFEGLKDIDNEYIDGKQNPSFLRTGEITELRHLIEVYQSVLATSGNYFREFKLVETNQQEFEAYTKELGELSSILSMMDLSLREKMVERSMDSIDMERLKDSLDPSFTQASFREGSEQMHAVTQKFMTTVLKANDKRRIDRQRAEKKINKVKDNFQKWATSKGMTLQEGYDSILTKNTANFASQFKHEFWVDLEKAMKTKDIGWLNKHLKLKKDAQEIYNRNRQNFINKGYTAEEVVRWEENNQIKDTLYNPRRWRMYYEIQDVLPVEYYTEQYAELLKPGNEAALEFYHTMLDMMQEAKDMMGIRYSEGIPYNLLPNIRADLLRQFLDYGFNFDSIQEIFSSSFNTRPDDTQFGSTINLTRRVNPITGEFLPEVPILHTRPIRNKKGEIDNTLKSRDIAPSVLIFYDMALNYKYMTEEVEPYVEAWRYLIAIEGNRALTESGKNILTPTEEQHRIGGSKTRALDTFNNLVDYHVYGIRIPSSGVSKKQQKVLMSLKSWHAKKELAFAPIAQIGNFTQIRAGAFFTGLAGYHYTSKQFRKASNMRMRKNELYRAIVQFIEPSPGRAGIVTKNMASRKVSKIVNWDTAFWGFRRGEETVNDDALIAIMMNYGYDNNGNIKRLKRLPEGTKSLFENSRVEDGRLIIDGIIDSEGNVDYDTYTALRRLAKGVGTDIKGQPDSQNPQGINLKLWGNMMMQYKGWMPGMVYARLGDIHYSPDRQTLVEGKFRSLMSDLKSDTEKSIAGLIFTEALPRLIQFTALMPVMMVTGKGYQINQARAEIDFKRFQSKFPNDPYVQSLSFEDFMDYRQGQVRSLAAELTTILSLVSLILAMSASWKDDDDPWFSENYLTRTTFRLVNRAKREIAFMVDLNSWKNTFLQTPIPILGYINDLTKLWSSTMDQIGDDVYGKDVERDGLAGALFGRNIGGSARDKRGRFYETTRWTPLNKSFKFFEVQTAHRESIY